MILIKGAPTGKETNNTNMDHTVSGRNYSRSHANAHMTKEEQVSFANSEKNLNLMDSAQTSQRATRLCQNF